MKRKIEDFFYKIMTFRTPLIHPYMTKVLMEIGQNVIFLFPFTLHLFFQYIITNIYLLHTIMF